VSLRRGRTRLLWSAARKYLRGTAGCGKNHGRDEARRKPHGKQG
jgi:hypothetical protein